MARRVLVVDDDPGIRDALRMILEYEGYQVLTAADGKTALASLDAESVDAVLLDIKMPGMDGLEILDRIAERDAAPPVLMISGHGDIATAVEATRRGAVDFLEKPPERERILVSLQNALSRNSLVAENERLRQKLDEESVLVGKSAPMQKLRAEVARAAPTTATVLIMGESGTGKELVAREIHTGSRVAGSPFIQVNCAAIPEELIESELFGHEKGSFTGAVRRQTGKFVEADGGTIFLDEVGDMSARAQAKVLRVLEAGEVEPVGAARVRQVNVRVIAATNRDLTESIREALPRRPHFRLNVLPVRTPRCASGLRTSRIWVEHFTRLFSSRDNRKPRRYAPGALAVLKARSWPGNVRELKNLRRAGPHHGRQRPDRSERPAARGARVSDRHLGKRVAARDTLGVQGIRGTGIPCRQAARERLEHQPHGRGHRDAPLEPLQEDRASQDQPRGRRLGTSCSVILRSVATKDLGF
jgi:two-component system nitrogen regulation response regulator NtrX